MDQTVPRRAGHGVHQIDHDRCRFPPQGLVRPAGGGRIVGGPIGQQGEGPRPGVAADPGGRVGYQADEGILVAVPQQACGFFERGGFRPGNGIPSAIPGSAVMDDRDGGAEHRIAVIQRPLCHGLATTAAALHQAGDVLCRIEAATGIGLVGADRDQATAHVGVKRRKSNAESRLGLIGGDPEGGHAEKLRRQAGGCPRWVQPDRAPALHDLSRHADG